MLVVLALVLGVLGVQRVLCGRQKSGDVAIPPVAAGPVEVVKAYVAALDKHDIPTAKAVSTPEKAEREDAPGRWYHDTRSITDLEVREPIPVGPGSGETLAGDREAVWVPVSFDLDQCQGDGTLPDGDMTWGYLLSRDPASGRWLITDEGHG